MSDPDVSPAVLPLVYEERSGEGDLARRVVRVLAALGVVIGSLGVLSIASVLVTIGDFFRPRLFGADVTRVFGAGGGWIEVVVLATTLGWLLSFVILLPSAVASLRLRPAGRTGMLWFAGIALAVGAAQLVANVLLFAGLWTGIGRGSFNGGIWLASSLLQIIVEMAYPVVILLILGSQHLRDVFQK